MVGVRGRGGGQGPWWGSGAAPWCDLGQRTGGGQRAKPPEAVSFSFLNDMLISGQQGKMT